MAWSEQHCVFVDGRVYSKWRIRDQNKRAFYIHFALGHHDSIHTGPTIINWASDFSATSSVLKRKPPGRIRTFCL